MFVAKICYRAPHLPCRQGIDHFATAMACFPVSTSQHVPPRNPHINTRALAFFWPLGAVLSGSRIADAPDVEWGRRISSRLHRGVSQFIATQGLPKHTTRAFPAPYTASPLRGWAPGISRTPISPSETVLRRRIYIII